MAFKNVDSIRVPNDSMSRLPNLNLLHYTSSDLIWEGFSSIVSQDTNWIGFSWFSSVTGGEKKGGGWNVPSN